MKIAGVLLKLPDGRLVLHRRDKNAPASPEKLGFFGGKIEKGETPEQAALREIGEETSIDASKVQLRFVAKYEIPEPEANFTDPKTFSLFESNIASADFKVLEGIGLEVYSTPELLKRKDLTPSVRYSLENLLEEAYGVVNNES